MASRGISLSTRTKNSRLGRHVPTPEVVDTSVLTEFPLEAMYAEHLHMATFTDAELRKTAIPISSRDMDDDSPGLMSLALGPWDGERVCATCQLKTSSPAFGCPGHLGRILLNTPIIKPLFYPIVFKVLQSICADCGRTVLARTQLEKLAEQFSGTDLVTEISKKSKNQPCSTRTDQIPEGATPCRAANPDYKKSRYMDQFKVAYVMGKGKSKDKTIEYMDTAEVYRILSRIPEEDARLLGFPEGSHPKDMITWILPVIPPCSRPPRMIKGRLEPHELTARYRSIMELNDDLRTLNRGTADYDKKVKELNMRIFQLVENKESASANQAQVTSSILSALKGKGGAMRSSVLGKRTNQNARAVAGPAPELEFDEIHIPRFLSTKLTMPVMVTQRNIKELSRLWARGKISSIEYGKIHTVIKNGVSITEMVLSPGMIILDDKLRQTYRIKVGDRVHRHLQDGDMIILNRNPTLHRGSMMGHRVKLVDTLTISFPLAVTAPYNADFDGDEMNAHAVQTDQARAELTEILSVRECMLDDRISGPRFGLVFDALTMAPVLTWDEIRVPRFLFMELHERITNPDKDTMMERLDRVHRKNGGFYRFQVWDIPQPSNVIAQRIIDSGISAGIINPPETLQVPDELLRFGTGPYRILVEFSFPLNAAEAALMEYLEPEVGPLGIQIQDEFSGKATLSLALPAGFRYSRGEYSNRVLRIYGPPDQELMDIFEEAIIPHKHVVLFSKSLSDKTRSEIENQLLEVGLAVDVTKKGLEVNMSRTEGKSIPAALSGIPHEEYLEFTDLNGSREAVDIILGIRQDLTWTEEVLDKPPVRVEDGILWSGVVNKSDVGAKPNSMTHRLLNYYDISGTHRAAQFISDLPWITNRWGMMYGFTLGYTDCEIPKKHEHKLQAELARTRLNVRALGPEPSDPVKRQKYEEALAREVYRPTMIGGQIQEEIYDKSNFLSMTSKGDATNFAMVSGIIGQQYFKGRRLGLDRGRFIVYYDVGDRDISAHGYVVSNFLKGVSAAESFMLQFAGKEGLIDKAIKTALTGYASRRLDKALESISVKLDGSARDFKGNIFQIFALDLFSAERIEPAKTTFANGEFRFADIDYIADLVSYDD